VVDAPLLPVLLLLEAVPELLELLELLLWSVDGAVLDVEGLELELCATATPNASSRTAMANNAFLIP
jgi:hypothetical protein